MKNISWGGMKAKLTGLFLLVSLIPLLAVGFISYKSSKNALEKGFTNNFRAISQGREEAVIRYLRTKTKVTASFATDIFIRNTVEKIGRNGPDAAALTNALVKYLSEDKRQVDSDAEMTSIVNLKGKIIASDDKNSMGEDKSKDLYFTEGKLGVHIKDPYISSTGKECIAVSMPLKSSVTGLVIGVVVNRYELQELNRILSDREGMGDTGETYLLNSDGYMTTDSRSLKDTFLKRKVDSEAVKLFQSQKKEFTGIYKDYNGVDVLGVTNGLALDKEFGLGWVIVAEIDSADAFSAANRLRDVMMVIILMVVVIVVLLAIWSALLITRPIAALADAAAKVTSGDLTGSMSIKGDDEIGALAESFSAMLRSLNEIMTKTRNAVGQITSASGEILSASQQQAASAREQSAAVSEATSAAEELSKGAEQIGENTKRVSQAASHSLTGMAKIKDAIGVTGEKMTSLSEKSQQIGKITELINDVADQTNLLAVNAAIEAARAGEHGRGFTVVADEIRKLSDSTAKSTKDITALIEIIEHDMSNAIMAMEQSTANVATGTELSQKTAESAKEIAMGVGQQVSGSKQIAEAMGSINEVMKQIAVGAGQSQAAAKQLATLAGELKDTTGRFKL